VSAHRGLADVEAGLEPFAVKAGGVPEQVGEAHRRITSRISSLLLAVRDSLIAIASGSGSRCDARTVAGLTVPRFRGPAGMAAKTTAIPVTRFVAGELRRRQL